MSKTVVYTCDRCGAREPSQPESVRRPGIYPLPVGWQLVFRDDELRCGECNADVARGRLVTATVNRSPLCPNR